MVKTLAKRCVYPQKATEERHKPGLGDVGGLSGRRNTKTVFIYFKINLFIREFGAGCQQRGRERGPNQTLH